MLLGAPCSTNNFSTASTNSVWLPVLSLPSEKVPAPPSPNWMLEFWFSLPVLKKLSTSNKRSSTFFPRSIIETSKPLLLKI